ncbi:SDR family NAD(P)-dependent oxidoreductase [Pontibacter sp. G13]|uniref:SDR family NAD(P)-dependent oxidoreductase n=1 Tax=Pontibacter sp. G13 TaxID=3074898 RepID=UPI00288BA470|nr:SDR family NAD(P)-dependent oxidoreductase [Pontibacter sp. G13]WNJ17823.1 SDR family NAD(P)-dependent oxidoreductase [Pontibacter sp. G13]
MKLKQTRVILTGAASGIGKALLKELVNHGARVIAADIHALNLRRAVAAFPKDQVMPFVGDLSSKSDIDLLFDVAANTFQKVDLFIANAGFAYFEKMNHPRWDRIEEIFHLNTFSPIYSLMKMKQMNLNRRHKVVMISSAMAFHAIPGYALYGATKAALWRFADAYRFETKKKRLMMVYPASTATSFFEEAGKDIPKALPIQTPETVAKSIIQGILKDQAAVYPSLLFRFSMFLDRIFPWAMDLYQSMQAKKFEQWVAAQNPPPRKRKKKNNRKRKAGSQDSLPVS